MKKLWSGYKTANNKKRQLQNSAVTKQRITKQRMLQNSDRYKTAKVTKQRILQQCNLLI